MGNQLQILKIFKQPCFKQNSVICLTGASSGIGKQLALSYSKRKCRLLLAARNIDNLKAVAEICRQNGSKVEIFSCDVSNELDCKNLIAFCIYIFGELDLLILNAGINAHFQFELMDDMNIFHKIMQTNFFGYLYCTKYAWPYLKHNKGQILALSSLSGEVGLPHRTAYCSSKCYLNTIQLVLQVAVVGFFESLRIEQATDDVSITIICPPTIQSDMRLHQILNQFPNSESSNNEVKLSVEECVKTIIQAADRRGRKIFFPLKAYIAVYLRPFFPDYVDNKFKKLSKL